MPLWRASLWPKHLRSDARRRNSTHDLALLQTELIIRKGFHPSIDSYSAFYENDRHADRTWRIFARAGNSSVIPDRLATDFCVTYTALDARREGLAAVVVRTLAARLILNGSFVRANPPWSAPAP